MQVKKPNILVIDDQEANLYVMKHLLASIDCNMVTALSGYSAIEKAKNIEFDLALIDIRMPGLDGFQTARELHQHQKDLAVIFVTAEPKDEQKVKNAVEEGAVDILFKPLDEDILNNKINALLKITAEKKALAQRASLSDFQLNVISEISTLINNCLKTQIDELSKEFTGLKVELEKVELENTDINSELLAKAQRCSDEIIKLNRVQRELTLCSKILDDI